MSQAEKKQEVVAVEHMPPAEPASNLIQVIERAALNPDVDIEKMERLLAMQERIIDRQSEQDFNIAMTEVQIKTRPVSADTSNPQTRSKYASYAALDKALRPIYTAQGFSLSFDTGDGAPEQFVRVVAHVSHVGGHSRQYHADMPADGKGAKGGDVMTKTHATGAAMSYGMRYLLKMIFNVAIGEDDDDGNESRDAGKISDAQVDELIALADEVGADKVKLCAFFKIASLADVPASSLEYVKKTLEKKRDK